MKTNKILILAIISLLSVGCSNVFTDDLDTFIKEAKTKKEKVPEIPKILDAQKVAYVGGTQDIKDPFINTLVADNVDIGIDLSPDKNRKKEFLEGFALESLTLMGTIINKNKETEAILKIDDGTLYLAKTGNYIGQNYGQIVLISDTELKIIEKIQDEAGKWVEQPNQKTLAGTETKK